MSRYIDADALIAELQKDEERFDKEADDCRKNARNYTACYMQAMSSRADGIRDAIVEVYDAPSIDIVRCSECIFDTDYYFKNDIKQHRYEWCYEFCDVDGHCPFGKKRSGEEREGE